MMEKGRGGVGSDNPDGRIAGPRVYFGEGASQGVSGREPSSDVIGATKFSRMAFEPRARDRSTWEPRARGNWKPLSHGALGGRDARERGRTIRFGVEGAPDDARQLHAEPRDAAAFV